MPPQTRRGALYARADEAIKEVFCRTARVRSWQIVLQKSPRRSCRIEIRNNRIGANGFLIIAVDVRRFGHAINTDEVFGTHRARQNADGVSGNTTGVSILAPELDVKRLEI